MVCNVRFFGDVSDFFVNLSKTTRKPGAVTDFRYDTSRVFVGFFPPYGFFPPLVIWGGLGAEGAEKILRLFFGRKPDFSDP